MPLSRIILVLTSLFCVVWSYAHSQVVQFRDPDPAAAVANDEGAMVRLNLRGDVELGALIEYVGKRLGVSFIYDRDTAGRRVNVRAPEEVPVKSLLHLLGSVLKMEGLILVESDTPGWLRIVESRDMVRLSKPKDESNVQNPATPVTQMFVLENTKPQSLTSLLQPFLSSEQADQIVGIDESNTLIITDYPGVLEKVATLIRMLDRGRGDAGIRYYRPKNASVDELVTKVGEALDSPNTKLIGMPDTQVVAVVGSPDRLEQALEFLKRFDVPIERTVKVHRFQNIRAERVESILQGMLDGENWARFTITSDRDANLLVIRATPEVHSLFDNIIKQLDQPTDSPATPLRFYKLQNAKAIEVFFTLQALQQLSVPAVGYGVGYGGIGGVGLGLGQFGATPFVGGVYGTGAALGGVNGGVVGTPYGPSLLNPQLNTAGMYGTTAMGGNGFGDGTISGTRPLETTTLPLNDGDASDPIAVGNSSRQRVDQLSTAALSQLAGATGVAALPGGARVSIDVASNSLIVVAPTEVHRMYEQIIRKLDVRRPQVLIEAHIVAIDTSDRFQLGVEVSGGDRTGARRLFNFTSFGLSEVDPATGQLTINPGLGFNGVLVDPDVADVILQALVTHSRAHVLSSPQLLVNDNSTGQLESTASVPFQSVNASNTVSTTSLGGNQDAGTKLTVTPQINEGQHLHLDFSLEFSTFSGESTDVSLPPPRQIDRVASQVTIPNGHTVIVGGLNRKGQADSFTGVPWLEYVPVLRELSSLRAEQDDTTSFFLFIRPNILRDGTFRDLKHFSRRSLRGTGAKGDYPESRPIMMK